MRRNVAGLAVGFFAVLVVVAGSAPHVAAAAAASDTLKRAGVISRPSVVLVELTESAFVQDNRDGKTYGQGGAGVTTPFSESFIGSGWFVSADGFIVTAAHVAAPTDEMVKHDIVLAYVDQDAVATGTCTGGDTACLTNVENQFDASYMLASKLTEQKVTVTVFTQNMTTVDQGLPATVAASSPTDTGHDTAVIKVNVKDAPVLQVGDSSKVQVGDDLSVIGYPAVADVSHDLSSSLIPTTGNGTVTAIKTGPQGFANGVTVFQTDGSSGHGDSGGPAVASDGSAIGLVSFGNDSSEKTGFLITSNDIADTMRQAGVKNTPGEIDRLWREGLSYYDQKHYKAAEQDFHQCTTLNAAQVGCKEYDALATQNFSKDVPLPAGGASGSGSSFPILPVGIGAGVLVLVILAAVVLTRRKTPAAAAPTFLQPPVQVQVLPQPPAPALAPPAPIVAPPPTEPPPPPVAPTPVAVAPEVPVGPKFCPECGAAMGGLPTCPNGHSL